MEFPELSLYRPPQTDFVQILRHLFVLDVEGKAGKFSFIPFFINLGAGLALLSIATIICDVFVLYFLKDRKIYYEKKYLQVKGSDAFDVYSNINQDEDEEEEENRGN